MVNAAYLAGQAASLATPRTLRPETTDGREGFIHPISVEGRTERAVVNFILRDFTWRAWPRKAKSCRAFAEGYKLASPARGLHCKIRKQYRNMAYWLRKTCARSSWPGKPSGQPG